MRETRNHFDPSEQLSNEDDNQFLVSPSRQTSPDNKSVAIQQLQAKNARLNAEIAKIQRVLNEPEEKIKYGIRIQESKSETTSLQLQNAYKQIQVYEYEIKKLRAIESSGSYVERIKKTEAVLKEKEELSDKLRRQLGFIKKQSMKVTKSLKDDSAKQFYQTKSTKLSSEIKYLREKVKELESRDRMSQSNRQKQKIFIAKIEEELIKSHFDEEELKTIKSKYMYVESGKTYYSSNQTNQRREDNEQEERYVEDRTPQAYRQLMSEKALLQKMSKDYQLQLQTLQRQRLQAAAVNLSSRNKILEIEDEIEKVENRINQMKKMIDPMKLKPQRALSMHGSVGRYGDVNKSLSAIKSPFNHLYKNLEIGKISKNGRRFSDRLKIGKNQSKIVAIDFYENKEGNGNVVGFQVTYDMNKVMKKGAVNMIHDPKSAIKKTVNLIDSEDYFKTMECLLNEKGVIIAVSLTSCKGVGARAGPSQGGSRRPLDIARLEYPACLYGSFTENGLQLLGCEVLQQIQ